MPSVRAKLLFQFFLRAKTNRFPANGSCDSALGRGRAHMHAQRRLSWRHHWGRPCTADRMCASSPLSFMVVAYCTSSTPPCHILNCCAETWLFFLCVGRVSAARGSVSGSTCSWMVESTTCSRYRSQVWQTKVLVWLDGQSFEQGSISPLWLAEHLRAADSAVKTALAWRISLEETMSFGFSCPIFRVWTLPFRALLCWGSGGNPWRLGRARWRPLGMSSFPVTWSGVILKQATTTTTTTTTTAKVREFAELLSRRRSSCRTYQPWMVRRDAIDVPVRTACFTWSWTWQWTNCRTVLGDFVTQMNLYFAQVLAERDGNTQPFPGVDVNELWIGRVRPKFQVQLPPAWVLLQHATSERYHAFSLASVHTCLVQRQTVDWHMECWPPARLLSKYYSMWHSIIFFVAVVAWFTYNPLYWDTLQHIWLLVVTRAFNRHNSWMNMYLIRWPSSKLVGLLLSSADICFCQN